MREIKFRVWHKPNNEMFEWEKVKINPFSIVEDDQLVVMQYTGLKDRNGREIYEGDILLDDQQAKGIVFFEDGSFRLTSSKTGIRNYDEYDTLNQYLVDYNELEVIGNIYKNHDLLNEKQAD